MDITNINLGACPLQYLSIGYVGETGARPVSFDFSAWATEYGAGVLQLLLQRPGDEDPYPVMLDIDGTTATWTPDATATDKTGQGQAQLVYTVGGVIVKNAIFRVLIAPSLGASGDPPEPYEDWLERLLTIAAETQQSALDAAESAEAAGTSADLAAAAKTAAETAQTGAEAAKTGAEAAETTAGQSAALARAKAAEAAEAAQIAGREADYAQQQNIAAGYSAESAHDDAERAAQSAEDAQTASSAAQTAASAAAASASAAAGSAADAASAVTEVETKGAEQITAINQAGTTQIAAVDAAGAVQVQAIEDKGEEVIASIPSDYTELADDVSDLKSSFDSLEGGTTGQVLRKKSSTDFDVEWASVAQPTDEQVDTAVNDWLDDHPEATTTVQDGSLTEAKFEPDTLAALKNDYVTPEMFGAVGDGVADDTQAIKDMFASNSNKYVFLHDTYLVTGGIDVTRARCVIDFLDRTTFTLQKNYDVRDFDYVINFAASGIRTKGQLFINANFSVNVGIMLSQCAKSTFDHLAVDYARVWGICTDCTNAALGSMRFHRLEATACGYKVQATGRCVETGLVEITNMSVGNQLTESAVRSIFDYSKFRATRYWLTDSEYNYTALGCRFALYSNTGIVLNPEDYTKGTFSVSYGRIYPSFNDGDNGRDIFIPIGGGIQLCPSRSEGIYKIDYISTQRCPIGTVLDMQYGGVVDELVSQYDTIVMASTSFNAVIQYMYTEGVGTGFNYTEKFDKIYLICPNTNTYVEVLNPFIGKDRLRFEQQNEVACAQESTGNYEISAALNCSLILSKRKLNSVNGFGGSSASAKIEVTEYSPREVTFEASGYTNRTITLNLLDLDATRKNRFSPFRLYAKNIGVQETMLGVTLSQKLIDAGYTIDGAIDNVFSIDTRDYDNMVLATIVLFNKTFYITAEKVIKPDYAVQSDIPVSILSPSGDGITLEPYPVTYNFGEKAALSVTVTADTRYYFMFKAPASVATELSINGIFWRTGNSIDAGGTYVVDIWAGIATITKLALSPVINVGTDLVGLFIGRNSSGAALMESNKDLDSAGEIVAGGYYASDVFLPVNPAWRYEKNGWRIYKLTYYDNNYGFITQNTSDQYNNLSVQEIINIPSNAAYFRFCTIGSNLGIAITRIE